MRPSGRGPCLLEALHLSMATRQQHMFEMLDHEVAPGSNLSPVGRRTAERLLPARARELPSLDS